MRNLGLALILLMVPALSQAAVLPWTMSSDSVQAIVFTALEEFKAADDSSPQPRGWVRRDRDQRLRVEYRRDKVVCGSKQQGMLTVQAYQCALKNARLPWSLHSNSVQAVLWNALHHLKTADEASPYPQRFVTRGEGNQLIVEDSNARLICDAQTVERLAVQTYRCHLEFKPPNGI